MNKKQSGDGSSKVSSIVDIADNPADTINEVIERAKIVTGSVTDTDLAKFLGITRQSISKAKARNKIPNRWIAEISRRAEVQSQWLLTGKGRLDPDDWREGLDHDDLRLLEKIIVMIENDIEKHNITITPKKKAMIIAVVFNGAYQRNGEIDKRSYDLFLDLVDK